MNHYEFTSKTKSFTYILVGIGLLLLTIGILWNSGGHDEGHGHHSIVDRIWSNLLIDGFFFFGIGVAGTFFLAVQYAANAGWSVVFKRIMEAISAYMPIGALFLVVVWIASSLHWNHLYHWMAEGVMDPDHEHYDAIIHGKQAYLNQPFFWARAVVFIGVWCWFAMRFRKRSLQEDNVGGTDIHRKNMVDSAIFLVFFGFTSMVAAWDWIMSIDTHWFSTIFGWYIFAGMWITGMITMTLLMIHLKGRGHLKEVNGSHIHDMGKWMFAISFLWAYLFFCQFMLIWYSNISEETMYYRARIDDYSVIFWGMFAINFIFPMLLLMSRDTKRNLRMLAVVGVIIFIGHWMDVYMLVTPGTMGPEGSIGFVEIGMFLAFLGFFIHVILRALSKAPVMVNNHPFLEESLHHEIH